MVKAECKLPTMYLIDSVVKNVGHAYSSLFLQNLVSSFCSVFEKVDEKVRMQLFKLRQTWNDIFPNKKLYAIDIRVKQIDPAWPVTAQPPSQQSIHVNPKFLKPTAEESVNSEKVQDFQEEEMRKQLLAKQQELLKLQRQKLELELLQTQVIVEEQKRQLYIKEQQMLRVQQHAQEEVQKALQQQQLATAVSSSALQHTSGGLDSGRLNSVTVEQSGLPTSSALPLEQSIPKSDFSGSQKSTDSPQLATQIVVSSPFMVISNKTIDTNSFAKKGPDVDSMGAAASSTSMTMASSVDSASANVSAKLSDSNDIKHVTCGTVLPDISIVHQDSFESKGSSKGKSSSFSKQSFKDGSASSKSYSDKKDKESSKKTLSPKKKSGSTSRRRTGSKEKSDSSRSSHKKDSKDDSSSSKDSSKSSKGKSSRSKSSPSRKDKRDQRRSSSRGHSRSPGCSSDKDDRTSKRSRRSPHKDKENADIKIIEDDQKSKLFSFSHKADVDLRTPLELSAQREEQDSSLQRLDGEPALKKSRIDEADLDIFSGKDQDYRQITRPVPARLSPIGEKSWAQYKASRPEEFKNPLRPRDNLELFGFGSHDLDLRSPSDMRPTGQAWTSRDPRISTFRDPRMRRNEARSYGSRLLPQQQIYQAIQESDPNIPRALMFDRGADIMRQADQQLKSGQLTLEQHAELMEQLAKLYELQRMRYLMREQQNRDKVVLHQKLSDTSQQLSVVPLASGKDSIDVVPMEIDEPSDVQEENTVEKMETLQENTTSNQEQLAGSSNEVTTSDLGNTNVANDVEVIVINDDGPEQSKSLAKSDGKRRGSRWSNPAQLSSQQKSQANTVMIDDKPREVLFIDGRAVVVLDNEDIREIGFRGPPQDIIFDDCVIRLAFGNMIKDFEVDGHMHTVQFGAPTREIIIDEVPYAAVFGGPPIVVVMHGKPHDIRLAGPTPEVFFGDKPRDDLLPLLRKSMGNKSQITDIRKEHLMDRSPPRAASPMRWMTRTIGRDYDPREWKSGRENWRGSGYDDQYRRNIYRPGERRQHDEPWMRDDDFRGPLLGGVRGSERMRGGCHSNIPMDEFYDRESRNSPYRDNVEPRSGNFYTRDVGFRGPYNSGGPPGMRAAGQRHRFDGPGPMNHFMPSSSQGMRPPAMVQYPVPFGYRNVSSTAANFASTTHHNFNYPSNAQHQQPVMVPPPVQQPSEVDVGELFAKLVSTGIIPQVSAALPESKVGTEGTEDAAKQMTVLSEEQQKPVEKVPAIELTMESLKVRYVAVISMLYCGIQCSSCGVRFTAEQTDKYAQHLDWHFRQNRREKNSARKALSRKWYYDVQDWVQFEEIEDLEERARSFFELQANEDQSDSLDDAIQSVAAGESEEDKKCCVCQEVFELYWNEDHEEWHFRDAVRHDEKNYHPPCYEDIKESPINEDTVVENVEMEDVSKSQSLEDQNNVENKVETAEMEIETVVDVSATSENSVVTKDENEVIVKKEGECDHDEANSGENDKANDSANVVLSVEVKEETPSQDDGECAENVVVKLEENVEGEAGNADIQTDQDNTNLDEITEDQADPETLSIFNVALSSCSIPPLIGFEVEKENSETSENITEEQVDESESPMLNRDEVECEQPMLNVEEQNSELSEIQTVVSQEKQETLIESVDKVVVADDLITVKQEAVEEASVENDSVEVTVSELSRLQCDDVFSYVDDQSLIAKVEREIEASSRLHVNVDAVVKKEASSEFSKDEEDVTLKESSDIIVDFAFDQPSPAQAGIMTDKLQSESVELSSGPPDEFIDDSNDADIEVDPKFKVLPPVNKGTELSGLCSIM